MALDACAGMTGGPLRTANRGLLPGCNEEGQG